MKVIFLIIISLSLADVDATEKTQMIIGKYLNARYKILFDRSEWTKDDSKNMKDALSGIDSLPQKERLKVYTLFYIYFDNDTEPAQTLTQIIINNKDVSEWKSYLMKKEYDVKREYGEKNYQYLICKLAMLEKYNAYNLTLFKKTKECSEIESKKN